MVRFTGKFRSLVMAPNKPIRRGIRLYSVNDAKTGYMLSCLIHAGAFDEDSEDKIYQKVWQALVQGEFLDQGYGISEQNTFCTVYAMLGMLLLTSLSGTAFSQIIITHLLSWQRISCTEKCISVGL